MISSDEGLLLSCSMSFKYCGVIGVLSSLSTRLASSFWLMFNFFLNRDISVPNVFSLSVMLFSIKRKYAY